MGLLRGRSWTLEPEEDRDNVNEEDDDDDEGEPEEEDRADEKDDDYEDEIEAMVMRRRMYWWNEQEMKIFIKVSNYRNKFLLDHVVEGGNDAVNSNGWVTHTKNTWGGGRIIIS